jgi:hypothetical protein
MKVISIDTFTEEEAIEFIKKELDINDESQEKEILQLAKTLQCFPLALQQAVAYNNNNNNFINHNLLIKNTNVLLQSYFKNISNYLIKNFQNSLRMS